jgi:YHS domain-containing protein
MGCGTAKTPDATQKQGLAAPPSAASLAILAKADASDGSVDKVVSRCVTCRLVMEGKPEYSVNYGGYAVHLCSEECKKAFSENPEKALQALTFPEEKK